MPPKTQPATKAAQQPAAPQSPTDEQRRQDASEDQAREDADAGRADQRDGTQAEVDALEAAKGEQKRQEEAQKAADRGETAQPGADFDGAKVKVISNVYFALGRETLEPNKVTEVDDSTEVRDGLAAGLLRLADEDEDTDSDDED